MYPPYPTAGRSGIFPHLTPQPSSRLTLLMTRIPYTLTLRSCTLCHFVQAIDYVVLCVFRIFGSDSPTLWHYLMIFGTETCGTYSWPNDTALMVSDNRKMNCPSHLTLWCPSTPLHLTLPLTAAHTSYLTPLRNSYLTLVTVTGKTKWGNYLLVHIQTTSNTQGSWRMNGGRKGWDKERNFQVVLMWDWIGLSLWPWGRWGGHYSSSGTVPV